ncbi:MAG TPA: permease-like cell division protein FtsX, partial [Thermoanaerobaculia bacterium]
ERRVYQSIRPSDMQESYWVQLKDPEKFQGIKSAVQGMPGVNTVRDLRQVLKPIYFWINVLKWGAIAIAAFLVVAAVLQVGNTIRMAAFARRREIGIMRLVGASSLYIQLPFLMEALLAAVVGVALAAGTLLLFMWVVIYHTLRPSSNIVAWIDWGNAVTAIGYIALIGFALTLLPTLVMTRKYLKV